MLTPTLPDVDPKGKYTAGQAAKALGIHRNTFRKLVCTGQIEPVQFHADGTRLRFWGAKIQAYWRRQI